MSEENKKSILNDEDLEKVSGGETIIKIIERDTTKPAYIMTQCAKCTMSVKANRVGTTDVYSYVCPQGHTGQVTRS